jgi:hypothetical protein
VIVTEVAPVVFQARVEHDPAAILEGLAVKLSIVGSVAGGGVGGGAAVTVTVLCSLI